MMFEEGSDQQGCKKCCKKTFCENKCHTITLLCFVFFGLLSNVSDWLFYHDLIVTEKGLVYGPVNKEAVTALLTFCIIGTVIFLLDVISHVYSLCWSFKKYKKFVNTDLFSFLAILFGDIPQVSISVYVAHCREEGSSPFQFAKAAFVLLGGVIRILIFIHVCRKENNNKIFKIVKIFGLFINLGLLISVFSLGFTANDGNFFKNVGVFVQHPGNNSPNSWISVMSIYDIYKKPDISLLYIYRYEQTATHWNFAIWTKTFPNDSKLTEGSPECYQMELKTGNISTVNMSDCWNSLFSQPTSLHISFTYTPPGSIIRIKVLGDIVYNMKVMKNNSCIAYMSATNGGGLPLPTFGYFLVNTTLANFTGPHLLLDNGQPRFYRFHDDLQDIGQVWRTGCGRCESSGNRAPTFDSSVEVDCSN